MAVEQRPNKSGDYSQREEAQDFHIVIRGVTTAIGEDSNRLRQMKDMFGHPGHNFLPAKLIPFCWFFRVWKCAQRKWKAIQAEISKGKTECNFQRRIPGRP